MIGIYRLLFPSGKSYVGQSMGLEARLKTYSKHHCKSQVALYNALSKYGFDNVVVEILYSCEKIEHGKYMLNILEKHAIKKYNSLYPWGYNLTTGGDSFSTCEATKEKQRISAKNKPPIKDSTRIKLSISNKNKVRSAETKRNISIGLTGKKLSDEHKQNMSKAKLGKTRPIEAVEKQKETFRLKMDNKEIFCYDTNGIFICRYNNAYEARLGKPIKKSEMIHACCRHPEKRKKCGGYKWSWIQSEIWPH